ncbi:MAG: hypothetical protein H0V98_00665 [Chloroflexia bacterium]|nr:hypothetical protein [Chloroflexia bacterium]
MPARSCEGQEIGDDPVIQQRLGPTERNLYAAMFAWLQRHEREVNREIVWIERYGELFGRDAEFDMEIWLPLRQQD